MYQGKNLSCLPIENGCVELKFNSTEDSVNKFNIATMQELREAVDALKANASSIKGLLVTSAKDVFIVGADITEFLAIFKVSDEEFTSWLMKAQEVFCDLEDLPFPTVCAINGYALGGGFEFALSCDYRVMSEKAKVGLPEVKLGIFPGYGGTIRLSRLSGADNAIEWIAQGSEYKAKDAFAIRAVDAQVEHDQLRTASLSLLSRAIDGTLNWQARKEEKKGPLRLNDIESMMVFEGAKAFIAGKAGPHYPAPVEAVSVMQKCAKLTRDEAIPKEVAGFIKVARTPTAKNLVTLFLGHQYLKKQGKGFQEKASDVKTAAVLGAGIMGGGVAYQSAYKGIPIYMKDINEAALDLGLKEASKLLDKRVQRKRMTTQEMANTLGKIRATLSYDELKNVDVVVEAVVENMKVKKQVYSELEDTLRDDAVLATNTSTIAIDTLAEGLKRPENFCGMHFFNPVHKMPLVEVIRGSKTSEKAIATTVAYATAMGKTPVVVNDCPGFLVNRILMPYFGGFMHLLNEGVDYLRVDKVMEKFGWPMGPAYLLDVVGTDTAHHAASVMADGFPDRMAYTTKTALDVLYESERYGQKNGKGFYLHTTDKRGRPKKEADSATYDLLKPIVASPKEHTDEEIIDRLMIPMVIESARCLEDNIVETATEVDMGLIFGIGFPPFRGGALRYADEVGLQAFCEKAQSYSHLGKLYEPTESMKALAKEGKTFYNDQASA